MVAGKEEEIEDCDQVGIQRVVLMFGRSPLDDPFGPLI